MQAANKMIKFRWYKTNVLQAKLFSQLILHKNSGQNFLKFFHEISKAYYLL